MLGLPQTKRTLDWFEDFLRESSKQYDIERNHEEDSYTLRFISPKDYDEEKGYKKTSVAKFYRTKEDIEIYNYNGKDFELYVNGLSMLKYWIDNATPEERFADEIKSVYRHKNFKTPFGENLYLNIVKDQDGYPCLTTIGDRYEWWQKYFTDKEIDEYKREFGINLSEYEKIKEGAYVD